MAELAPQNIAAAIDRLSRAYKGDASGYVSDECPAAWAVSDERSIAKYFVVDFYDNPAALRARAAQLEGSGEMSSDKWNPANTITVVCLATMALVMAVLVIWLLVETMIHVY